MRIALRATITGAILSVAAPVAICAQNSDADPAAIVTSAVPARATITFNFSREVTGAPVPKYALTIRDDGSGSYAGEALPPLTRYGPPAVSAAVPFQRELRLTSATTARLFDLAGQLDHFNRTCASKAKNIADTGTKTLTYAGRDGSGSCSYNYTEIKELTALTEQIQGITETLDEGRELDRLHRYDRLGLDSAIAYLQQEVAAGRALELENIAGTLQAIAQDTDVLVRVRAKAAAMLAQIGFAEREIAH